MKKILIAGLIIGVFCVVCHCEHNYTREDCKVYQINDGYVRVEDKCGMVWDFEGDGFKVGDKVDLRMYDNCTSGYAGDDIVKAVVRKGNPNIVLKADK